MSAAVGSEREQRVVRVLPDVPAIDKEFDYLVPDGVEVHLGDVVRIELHGRRVGGWVVGIDVAPEPGVVLKALAKVSGRGPAPDLLDLAGWAAWRWAGRRASFLRTAAPPGVARFRSGTAVVEPTTDPSDRGRSSAPGEGGRPQVAGERGGALVDRALALPRAVIRLGPAADRYPLVLAATRAGVGQTLILCPSVDEAQALGRRLRRDGVRTAVVAGDLRGSAATGEWIHAATTAQAVVGARAAAWAPTRRLGRVVVLDEHDEAYQQEQTPTWHARDVVVERAARAGAPCVLVSPCPSLEALAWGELVEPGRGAERGAWPRVEVVDQRDLDPALGPLFSPRLVELVRGPGRVLCILNRTGRARLLACGSCRTIARCEVCDAAVGIDEHVGDGTELLVCGRCAATRPPVCLECGGARFKNLRLGVSRAREELEALAGTEVAEVTAATPDDDPGLASARVLVGTEALLHRVPRAAAVAFLDMDQELLALRYRAGEQALALVARAARAVARGGGRDGRVLIQTRTPDHPSLVAARLGDPARLVASELPMRRALGLPPATAMAVVSGAAAPAYVEALGQPLGLRIQGPLDGAWRLVAPDHPTLCDALAAVERPPGRLRLEVDPLRI